eukprot:TRINITY_DN14377_c0_g3_i1.p1 TRINITY_DN14377_c0_g3~~TRINITY_DN14377_c0_g3_i1.p1  ORF type:complete len:627 (+),score=100.04 TRINITY_DN14377_c0_g3_i1:53-1933(+)
MTGMKPAGADVLAAAPGHPTHDVLNQACPLSGYNAFLGDVALREGVATHGGEWGHAALERLGAAVGSEEWQARAAEANRHPPRLETHDRFGNRRDTVVYHPAYHQLLQLGLEAGVSAFAWQPEHAGKTGAHVIRAALMHLMYQLDAGVCCPMSMTFAGVETLRQQRLHDDPEGYVANWIEKLLTCKYDPANTPVCGKVGATFGMSMTEKQGGSDVRAGSTYARPWAPNGQVGPGQAYRLVGHKWFTSAPMCDAFLTLAKTETQAGEEEGLSCFIVPRWLPDGSRNAGFGLQRLKEKIGDRSNASSEVEYRDAWGCMIGEPGRGVRTIVEMVKCTRLDCIIWSAALMRLSAQLAARHACGRAAFGRRLVDQPLMRCVLADLAIESEAAMATSLRLARAFDSAAQGEQSELAFARLATAIGKYYICKRAPLVAYEAMECHGGNGYVEESPVARLFRQSPLNSIWEGSGNVICLDVLRALGRDPSSVDALLRELQGALPLAAAAGASELTSTYAGLLTELQAQLASPLSELEIGARALVDKLAVCLQAAVLLKYGDPVVAQAFMATRLPCNTDGNAGRGVPAQLPGHSMGALTSTLPETSVQKLIDRLIVSAAPSSTDSSDCDNIRARL